MPGPEALIYVAFTWGEGDGTRWADALVYGNLRKGANTVKLGATGVEGPNIDLVSAKRR